MRSILITLLTIASIICPTKTRAQKNVETQHLLWTGYSLNYKINKDWKLRQEVENRQYWFPYNQHQFIARTHLQRNLANGFSVAAGFTYFRQSLPHDPYTTNLYVQQELRPQFEIKHQYQLAPDWELTNRLWTEFRFFEQPTNGFNFGNTRFRYKLEAQYDVNENIKLKGYNEILINAGKNIVYNTFDQNRIGGSLTYKHDKNFSLELGYFNWFQ